jgi:hypothetical protein
MMIDENQALLKGLKKVMRACLSHAGCDDCLLYGEDGCMLNIYELGGRPYVWGLSALKGKEESR